MTMLNIPGDLGYGGAHLNRSVLREILVELQDRVRDLQAQIGGLVSPESLMTSVVSGAAAATDIAVIGIETGDTLVGVVKLDFTLTEGTPNNRTWAAADLLSEASITSDGNIQFSTTDTTGSVLVVIWLDQGG